jgi:hypothetical protein
MELHAIGIDLGEDSVSPGGSGFEREGGRTQKVFSHPAASLYRECTCAGR